MCRRCTGRPKNWRRLRRKSENLVQVRGVKAEMGGMKEWVVRVVLGAFVIWAVRDSDAIVE